MITPVSRPGSQSVPSLYEVAVREADAHKWIVSERLGRDGGSSAWREWWDRYWPAFCRHRRLEHLQGVRRWREFEEDLFARFYTGVVTGDLLLDRILDRVADGWENLTFVCWLHEWGMPPEATLDILEVININETTRLARIP